MKTKAKVAIGGVVIFYIAAYFAGQETQSQQRESTINGLYHQYFEQPSSGYTPHEGDRSGNLGFGGERYIDPYFRADGTYVEGHYRSGPDGFQENNWSHQGNENPHTGNRGYAR